MYKIGDIVLTPFPFTDLSGNKVRPALVLGFQRAGDDVTVCFVSSIHKNKIGTNDVLIKPVNEHFSKTGLKVESIIKVTKIATLDRAVILGKIGNLDSKNLGAIKKILKNYFDL